MHTNYLLTIVGPTAIGKTSLSIKLAKTFKTEILSADSRQFYREMKIGTAAPNAEELNTAPHHFIHHISVTEDYSVGDFERDALQKTEDLFQNKSLLILVGGSGLYLKSFLEGLDDFPEINPAIRLKLNKILTEKGLEPLKQKLKNLDPTHYNRIDTENPHRLIRALEVCLGTKKPYSSFLDRPKASRNFKPLKIGLTAPREVIYDRINQRVDLMMQKGLLAEAQQLYPYRKYNALNTVGYKELFSFIEGNFTLEQAVEEIKKNTRRFAKRQLTWFRKEEDVKWFDYLTPTEEIENFIKDQLRT